MNLRIMISVCIIYIITLINSGTLAQDFDSSLNQKCPESNKSDILLIHGFMLKMSKDDKMKGKFETSTLREKDKETFESYSKKEQNTLQLFEEYWKEKGVERVIDIQVCEKILSINELDEKSANEHQYREVIYKVRDKYIILFTSKNVMGTGSNIYPDPIVLDMEFNIIDRL